MHAICFFSWQEFTQVRDKYSWAAVNTASTVRFYSDILLKWVLEFTAKVSFLEAKCRVLFCNNLRCHGYNFPVISRLHYLAAEILLLLLILLSFLSSIIFPDFSAETTSHLSPINLELSLYEEEHQLLCNDSIIESW